VSVCVAKYNVVSNATGMVEGDWDMGGEYYGVAGFIKLPFPWICVVSFLLVTLLIAGFIAGYHFLQKNKRYVVSNPPLNPFKKIN